jgi:hypothetical protein
VSSGSAVLEKLEEIQRAFDQDFTDVGRLLVDAITRGDVEAEAKLRANILGLNGLRQRLSPVTEEIKSYLADHTLGDHPEDAGRAELAVATEVGTNKEAVVFPQLAEVPPPMASTGETEEESAAAAAATSATSLSEKDYNKADTYKPFFLEAISLLPGSKLADIQRKTHELMMVTKISGVRVGRDGDSERTNSGVYRYKAQTQNLRKRFEQEGLILVSDEGVFSLTPEGEKQRWGKMKPKDRQAWAILNNVIADTAAPAADAE